MAKLIPKYQKGTSIKNTSYKGKFTKGSQWEVVKDLKGYPSHEQGGVDIKLGKNGFSFTRNNSVIEAKHGLVLSNGSIIPDDKKNNFKYKPYTVVQDRPYTAVQDNTYVAPKVVIPLKLKKKQQFVPREQPVLKADTRTDQERKIAQKYTESVLNPSIRTQIGEALQKPLRWIADPVKGVGDIVSALAPNSALAKDLPNTNEETFEHRKKQLNPYTSNKEKINNTINEAIPLTNWALLNTLPVEAAAGHVVKSGKNLIKPGVAKSTNEVYEALGFDNVISSTDKIVWGHPAIGKTTMLKSNPDAFIDWDNEFNRKRDSWIANKSNTVIGTQEFKKARNEYVINYNSHKDYVSFVKEEWSKVKKKANKENKTLIASPHMLLNLFPNDFDKVITMSDKTFIDRNIKRSGGDEINSKLWKEEINKTLKSVDKSKIVKTDKYINDLFITLPKSEQSSFIENQNVITDLFKPKFKSEIDWGKWNKEIPNNKSLMDEYLQIEKTTKQNGTWMKNSDGSAFNGTPEQFVQQNSSNFKKAFIDNFDTSFRGTHYNYPDQGRFGYLFSGNKNVAMSTKYTTKKPSFWKPDDKIGSIAEKNKGGLYELYSKKLPINIDANKSYFTHIEYPEIAAHYKNNSGSAKLISTDNLADYIVKNNISGINVSNVIDESLGNVKIINTNLNPVKSKWYNNGMFDMTNPNIYKGIIPPALLFYLQSQNQNKNEQ